MNAPVAAETGTTGELIWVDRCGGGRGRGRRPGAGAALRSISAARAAMARRAGSAQSAPGMAAPGRSPAGALGPPLPATRRG